MKQNSSKSNKIILSYTVPYADTDQMRVVYYANYFVYFERLRNKLIRKSGKTYLEVEKDGLAFPVIEAHCDYLKPAEYDDELSITGWLSWAEGSRFQVDYEIFRNDDMLASGYTIHLVINENKRPRRVPAEMLTLLDPSGSD